MAGSMTASEYASKWAKNTLANKESARKGVENIGFNPMERAAASQDRYASGCAEAAAEGRFAKGCRSVSKEEWQQAYLEKGLKNLDTGVRMGESKYLKFADQFMPFIQAASERIQKMDKGGRSNALARIEANLDALDQFKKSRRR